MPGAPHKALNALHIVTGCDIHLSIPPPVPPTGTPMPHIIVYVMGLAMPSTSKMSERHVKAGWGLALGRQHDLGMGIYHFWANWLLPAIWLGAGNKAEFGSGTVKLDKGRMAVAVYPLIGINLQLDCQQLPAPLPLPTSVCIASFNTVSAGFTWGDFFGGVFAMLFDALVTYAVNLVVAKLPGGLSKLAPAAWRAAASGVLGRIAGTVVGRVTIAVLRQTAKIGFDGSAFGQILLGMFVFGTPLGYSYKNAPVGKYSGDINDVINDTFSPDPPTPSGAK